MSGITFEWDRSKNSTNLRKHHVGFNEASTVFDDPHSITIPDRDHSIDEERFVIIGKSSQRSLLVVIHTMRGTADPPYRRSLSDQAGKTKI